MSKKLYDASIVVKTKKGKERLSFHSSEFTEEDVNELMKFLMGQPAHLEGDEEDN